MSANSTLFVHSEVVPIVAVVASSHRATGSAVEAVAGVVASAVTASSGVVTGAGNVVVAGPIEAGSGMAVAVVATLGGAGELVAHPLLTNITNNAIRTATSRRSTMWSVMTYLR